MPLVERSASFAYPTGSPGPIILHALHASASSSRAMSPDAVSTLPLVQQPQLSGKPPISPPHVLPSMARRSDTAPSSSVTQMPSLVRLPSLVTRTHQALHIQSPTTSAPVATVPHVLHARAPHTHRPSVMATPQVHTRLTPAVPLPPSPQPGTAPPSPRELAARLALLLHARECCTPLDMERVCGVRNCRVARGVLDHCQECFLPEGQCHRSCSEAKQLLRHFRVCRAQHFARACAICDVLRTDFAWAMQHARSLTPLFVPPQQAPATAATADHHDLYYYQQPPQHYEPQRRHSSFQPEALAPPPTTSLRRSVSEGPHATMSTTGHHKRSVGCFVDVEPHRAMEPKLTVKRVRIVTPTEEAEAAAKAKAMAQTQTA